MTSKNNKAHLRYYIKLCASFQSHWWIQTGVTVRKRSIRVKISDFLSHMTLKFIGWPWKIIEHLFYTTLSFVQLLNAIGIFKLELQSRNAQFGSKLVIFFYLENWRMTLKNNRAPFLYHIKLCAAFQSHWYIQTGDTVRKCSILVKIGVFSPAWPWKLMNGLEKQ